MRPVLAFVFLVELLISSQAALAAQSRVPVIISVGGTGVAQIKRGATTSEVQVGKKVEFGSIIQTGLENTVTVEYPDGSLVAIDADTRFEIQERKGGTQANALHSGQARGSIIKIKVKETQTKPRFMIRTKAAVMGVRGTEFVIAVDPNGMTTQVHTLEGVVDVAANESALIGGGGVTVPSGHYIEATPDGVGPAQSFDRSGFEQSLKPAIPGGPAQIALSAPGGGTVLKAVPALTSLEKSQESARLDIDQRREPQDPKQELAKASGQLPRDESEKKKPSGPGRNIRLLSFQGAFFFSPAFKEQGRPNGTGELIRAAALSWDPEFPIPLIPFLSVRGHAGVVIARDGSLEEGFLIREYQVFGTLSLLDRVFAEVGIGRMDWPDRGFSSGVASMNIGFLGGGGGAFSRIFVGRSELMTDPPEEQFRAGIGLSF